MTAHLAELAQLGARAEATPGTFLLPGTADVKNLVRNPSYEAIVAKTDRNSRSSSLSQYPQVGAAIGGQIGFEIDLYSAGQAALPVWGVLAKACGFANVTGGTSAAWVFNLKSIQDGSGGAIPTVSLSLNVDGYVHKLGGCRGNMKIKATAGGPLMAEFTFQGRHETPTDTAMQAWTADTNAGDLPDFTSAAVALAAVTGSEALTASEAILEGFEFDLGNELYLRPSANDATGFDHCVITRRRPKITIDPEWVTVAAFDAIKALKQDDILDFTTGSLTGKGANNNIQIDANRVQLASVGRQERSGVAVQSLELLPTRTASDDEVTITIAA